MNFDNLTNTLKKIIEKKAQEVGVTVDSYMESLDQNYCILNPKSGLLAWDDRYDYITYGSMEEAQADCMVGECVIKEIIALEMLNALLTNKF